MVRKFYLVGNVSVAGGSALMNVNHLREGHMFNSIESATILSVITFLTAGMLTDIGDEQYPALTEDWSAVLLDDKAKAVEFSGSCQGVVE